MTFGINFLFGLLTSASIIAFGVPLGASADTSHTLASAMVSSFAVSPMDASTTIPNVPFFSQFHDIQIPVWQKLGCGVTSLAMIIDFYHPETVSVNTLLKEGVAAGAYEKDAGWSHDGLIQLARKYGLAGKDYDLSQLDMTVAFARLNEFLKDGPVMASVHYKFDPKSTIPHLVVLDGIAGGHVYYNDPAGFAAKKEISIADFMNGWKKRFIVIKL